MAYGLWCIIGGLVLLVIFLGIKVYLLRKSAVEIRQAFGARLHTDTNTLIDISSRDREMRRLADDINTQLRLLRQQRQRYQQGNLELQNAITNIAHDLRTPLTALCGYLDLLEDEEQSETVRRYLTLISGRAEAMKSLTEELFQYSVTVSLEDPRVECVHVNQVLEESLLSFYHAMEQQGIHPKITISDRKVERWLNRSALFRIFENIISNALKYSAGDLEVEMDAQGQIAFTNTAPQLSSVEVGKLFDRFFTVETGRTATGLGLSIAKLLTERMGGKITAGYADQRLTLTLFFPEGERKGLQPDGAKQSGA